MAIVEFWSDDLNLGATYPCLSSFCLNTCSENHCTG